MIRTNVWDGTYGIGNVDALSWCDGLICWGEACRRCRRRRIKIGGRGGSGGGGGSGPRLLLLSRLDFVALSLPPSKQFLFGALANDPRDALELRTDAQHASDAAVPVLVVAQHRQEVHDAAHQADVRLRRRVVRVLDDVGEQGHQRGYGEV